MKPPNKRQTSILFFSFAFALIVAVSNSPSRADWPMFHGSRADNRSTDTGLLDAWPESGPKLIWKINDIGEKISGYSSVSIQGNRLFTSGNRGGKSIVYCFNLDGKKLWEYDNGKAWTGSYSGTRSTPTIDGNRVYDFSAWGELVCLNIENGQKIWSRNILNDFEGENIIWALAESVRIDGDRLICSPGGKKASVVALNKLTGEVVWETPSTGEKTSYSSAMIFEQDGLRILAMMYAKGLLGINADSGELLFTFPFTQDYDINTSRPIYHKGRLVIMTTNRERSKSGAAQLEVSVKGKTASVKEIWRNTDLDNIYDGTMLIDGYIYGPTYDFKRGSFVCVDWNTGKTVYSDRAVGRGCLTFAEGLLYVQGENRQFHLVRPNPEKYDIISRWEIPENGEGHSWAHPVIHKKRLYIRHGTFLYCYNITKE